MCFKLVNKYNGSACTMERLHASTRFCFWALFSLYAAACIVFGAFHVIILYYAINHCIYLSFVDGKQGLYY